MIVNCSVNTVTMNDIGYQIGFHMGTYNGSFTVKRPYSPIVCLYSIIYITRTLMKHRRNSKQIWHIPTVKKETFLDDIRTMFGKLL